MCALVIKAKITRANRKADGMVSLTVNGVSEIGSHVFAQLDALREVPTYVSFHPDPDNPGRIPEEPIEDNSLSPSKRLYNVIYVMYKQSGKEDVVDFDTYYKKVMEIFINNIKARLEPQAPQFW